MNEPHMNRRTFTILALLTSAGISCRGKTENLEELVDRIDLIKQHVLRSPDSKHSDTQKVADGYETRHSFKKSYQIGDRTYRLDYTQKSPSPQLTINGKLAKATKDFAPAIMDILRAIVIENVKKSPDRTQRDTVFTGNESTSGTYLKNIKAKNYNYNIEYSVESGTPKSQIQGSYKENSFLFVDWNCNGYLPQTEVNANPKEFRVWDTERARHTQVKAPLWYKDWTPTQMAQLNEKYDEVITNLVSVILK